MEIKILRPLEIHTKPVIKNNEKVASSEVKPSIKSDTMALSSIATQKAPPISASQKLTGLGERLVNQPILDHYKSFRSDPEYAPIVAAIDKVVANGGSIKDVETTAFAEVKKSNPKLSNTEVLSKGYKAILGSVIEKRFSDPNFFKGEKDKVFHYFVSSALTVEAYKGLNMSFLAPASMKRAMAGAAVISMGFLKEVASIPGNGYGADDMQANNKGIASAKAYLAQK